MNKAPVGVDCQSIEISGVAQLLWHASSSGWSRLTVSSTHALLRASGPT